MPWIVYDARVSGIHLSNPIQGIINKSSDKVSIWQISNKVSFKHNTEIFLTLNLISALAVKKLLREKSEFMGNF